MFLDWKNWIVKLTILRKAICRFSVMPVKSPRTFFTELGQKILQFVQKHERPQIAKAVLFLKKDLFYILAVVGPCCCTRTLSSCFQRELFVAVLGRLTVVALLVVEGAQALGTQASEVAVHRFSSCGRWAQLHNSMWDLPGSGTKLVVFLSLQGGFLTTGPSGKPGRSSLEKVKQSWSNQAP